MAAKKNTKPKAKKQLPGSNDLVGDVVKMMQGGALSGTLDPNDPMLPAPPGTYETYRQMNRLPTIALAQSVIRDPVRMNPWKWVDDGAPAGALDFIKATFDPMRLKIKGWLMRALDMGNAPFEVYWQRKNGNDVPVIRPLLWDITNPVQDASGDVVGIVNEPRGGSKVELDGFNYLWYTYDEQPGDPYGRSRHENIRSHAWNYARQLEKRIGLYVKKVSGVTIFVRYPIGTLNTESGAAYSTQALAKRMLEAAEMGRSIGIPNPFVNINQITKDGKIDIDTLLKFAELSKTSPFNLDKFDPGHSDFCNGFVTVAGLYDAWIVRGWLRPERSILEAKHGSRADSQTQTEAAVSDGEVIDADLTDFVNATLIDNTLELNFGAKARGTVRAICPPINDSVQKSYIAVMTAIINSTKSSAGIDTQILASRMDIPTLASFDPNELTITSQAEINARNTTAGTPSGGGTSSGG